VLRVAEEERPDLLQRFEVGTVPTLVVVEGKRVRARLERPRGCRDIEGFLAPWLNWPWGNRWFPHGPSFWVSSADSGLGRLFDPEVYDLTRP